MQNLYIKYLSPLCDSPFLDDLMGWNCSSMHDGADSSTPNCGIPVAVVSEVEEIRIYPSFDSDET